MILFLTLFQFNKTFQLDSHNNNAILFFLFIEIIIQIVLTAYIIFKERAVKPILVSLASSTTIIVFLIVFFIASEGLPVFKETSPTEFITGTTFVPTYEVSLTDTKQITISLNSYDYIVVHSEYYLLPTNKNSSVSFLLKNTGAENDTYYINFEISNTTYQTNTTIFLSSHEEKQISIKTPLIKTAKYTSFFNISSKNSSIKKTKVSTIIISPYAFSFTPKLFNIKVEENDKGFITIPLKLTNTGEQTDTYLIEIDAPSSFRPSIKGENIIWNFSSSSSKITIQPNDTKQLTLRPRLQSHVEDLHTLLVNVTSENHKQYIKTSKIYYFFKKDDFFTISNNTKSISPFGSTNISINLKGHINTSFIIDISKSNEKIHHILFDVNKPISSVNQKEIQFISTKKSNDLILVLNDTGSKESTDSIISINVTKGGSKPSFGIFPFIIGTIATTSIAVTIAAPFGLAIAILLAEFIPSRLRKILRPLYELLAGIPSVVYGLWGFLIFGPFLGKTIFPFIANTLGQYIPFFQSTELLSRSIMTASIVLSIMIIPIIITLSEDSIRSVSTSLKKGSLALGATRWQTMRRIILPKAKSGIISSIILGTGRAIGETMAVLMIMAFTTNIPTSVFDNSGTMTSVIASKLPDLFSFELARQALFAIAFVLFIMIFILNIIIFLVQNKAAKKIKKNKQKNKQMKYLLPHFFLVKNTNPTKRFKIIEEKKKTNIKKFLILDSTHQTEKKNISLKPKSNQKIPKQKNNNIHQTILGTTKQAKRNEKIVISIFIAAAIIISSFLFFLIGDIIINGGLNIKPEYLYLVELGGGVEGGFLNAIIGSLQLVGLALLIATPLSLGAAIYVVEYTKKSNIFTKIILFTSDTLASTPSIVFGAFGFIVIVWMLGFGYSLIAGGLTLGFMIIPIMLRSSIEAIKSVPGEIREGSYALGATKWQTIKNVVLPPAFPGITSGTIISVGRAIGETAAIIFTAGYSTHIATNLFSNTASLPNLIYKNYRLSGVFPELGEKVYSAAFLLIIIVLILNIIAKFVSYRSSKMIKE